MARNWTPAQQAAINERSRTLLVSAAAGSGKTAVLTERIIRTLCDPESPTDISRLLVVTFTRAAAAEMRARIAKALGDALSLDPTNANLRRQLMLLGSAKISTIDSFYLDLVRANFEAAGFSPSFRMADDGELLSLRRDTMNAAIDRMYATSPRFIGVADLLSDVRAEQSLTEALLALAARLEKLPEGYDLLLRAATENEALHLAPFDSPLGKTLYGTLHKTVKEGIRLYSGAIELYRSEDAAAALEKKFGGAWSEMLDTLTEIDKLLLRKDADALAARLLTPLTARVTSARLPACSDKLKNAAEACKVFREKWRARAAALGAFNVAEIREGGAEAAELLRLIHTTLTHYGKQYAAAKREREVAEFSDVSRAAYKLLVREDGTPTPLAASLCASFDAVYIDEYQDVDAMQDATFCAISTPNNRFMVGDIKQSIYRFRGADPDVFAAYRHAFPDLDGATDKDSAATVFMSSCFRCDENVIRFSNAVSGYLFSRTAESIGYRKDDDLVFSKQPPATPEAAPKCTVMIYDDSDDGGEEVESTECVIDDAEAKMIVREIKRLLASEKKADGTRITPGDVAVLARGAAFAAPLSRLLRAEGIPVNDTSRENFFENPEVLCMYSLLAAIDNPFRDVYLAAVMRSPFFGFTLEELVKIRQAADTSFSLFEAAKAASKTLADGALRHRVGAFLARIEAYRTEAELLPVDKLLRYLYRDTAVLSFAGGGAGEDFGDHGKRQNLLRLYEYARCFEAGGFKGLYRFVRYVEDIMGNGTEMPMPEGPRDAVSLITVHHSKGLEFPVCFVATTGKLFNADDQKDQLLIDGKLGCGTRLPNVGAFSRANTFAREAIKERLKQLSLEEEMRVLYVAMTRARERLYITAKPRYGMKNVEAHVALATCPLTSCFELSGNSYIEWILTALEHVPEAQRDFYEMRLVRPADLLEDTTRARIEQEPETVSKNAEKAEEIRALTEKFAARFDFTYAAAHLSSLPAKLSVSRLSPVVLDVYDNDAASEAELLSPDAERLLHTFTVAPQFGEEHTDIVPDAAARGTATHEFLQFCDLKSAETGLENELERLIGARFLPPEARLLVRISELRRFFESDFYKALKNAREIHRETRFNLFLPASDFTQNAELKAQLQGEKLLVQGVIDLFFTDNEGNLVLCDYKTDRLPGDALKNADRAAAFLFGRHGNQLSYYKKALAAICGKEPDKTLIYSLPFGEALPEPK